uniref:hypothetical protein n=1 Tax=Mariniflexile maritimum TaxID=2682493 RepID=UPI0018DCE231
CHSDSDFVLQVHANDFKEIKIPNISKIVFGSFIFFQLAGNGLVYEKLRVYGRGFSEGKSEASKRATAIGLD